MKKVLIIGGLLPTEKSYVEHVGGVSIESVWFSQHSPKLRPLYWEALKSDPLWDGVIIDEEVCGRGFSIEALRLFETAARREIKHILLITSNDKERVLYQVWRYDVVLQELVFAAQGNVILVNGKGETARLSPTREEIVSASRTNPEMHGVKNWSQILKALFPPPPEIKVFRPAVQAA